MIEKFVSPFIQRQFPSFYQEEGQNFIAFMKAYYEWAEQTDLTDTGSGFIGKARSIPEYLDIDKTEAEFIDYFTKTYIHNMSISIIPDRRMLVKHILELYRTKGTPRAYELLFRILFNEDIDLYIPADYIFKPSDSTWMVPRYVETTDSPYLYDLIGKSIYSSSGSATAVVENIQTKLVNSKTVNVIYISSLNGTFGFDDHILSTEIPEITVDNAPRVLGSLTAIAIKNGGLNFSVGDELQVRGSGIEGKARVASTVDENGKVIFTLVNGGSGYSLNPAIVVTSTINLTIESATGVFGDGDIVLDTGTNANGTITRANSTFIEIINYTGTPQYSFTVGDTITSNSGGSATIAGIIGGSGVGASFAIGALSGTELYTINEDIIEDYENVILDPPSGSTGFDVYITSPVGTFTVGNTATCSANVRIIEGGILTGNICSNGESLSNASLGISGLYVYKSDGSNNDIYLYTTGTDVNLENANIAPGVILVSNISSSQAIIRGTSPKETISGNAVIYAQTASMISLRASSGVDPGYFVHGATLTDSNTGATGIVNNTIRTMNWGPFSGNSNNNLDTSLFISLAFTDYEVGTIARLASINPGEGYTTVPYIDVNETAISGLGEDDGFGGIKGHNAVITGTVLNDRGIATAVRVTDSGFGYDSGETVTLEAANTQIVVTGTSIIRDNGKGQGRWLTNKSSTSDNIKLQDSNYYQNYSYEILAMRMKSTYEKLVRSFVHPSGIALFGRYRFKNYQETSTSNAVHLSLTQT